MDVSQETEDLAGDGQGVGGGQGTEGAVDMSQEGGRRPGRGRTGG